MFIEEKNNRFFVDFGFLLEFDVSGMIERFSHLNLRNADVRSQDSVEIVSERGATLSASTPNIDAKI